MPHRSGAGHDAGADDPPTLPLLRVAAGPYRNGPAVDAPKAPGDLAGPHEAAVRHEPGQQGGLVGVGGRAGFGGPARSGGGQPGSGAPEAVDRLHDVDGPDSGEDGFDEPDEPGERAGEPGGPGERARAAITGRVGTAVRRWVPEGWRGARLDPGRPGATALALVAAVAAVLAAVGVWSGRPQAEPVAALPSVGLSAAGPGAGPSTAADPAAGPPGPIVVSVAGKVARPGLVRVPGGSRVADVIDAAGGPLPGTDLSGTNLARRVGDGEQVAVGVPAAPDAAGTAAGPGADARGTGAGTEAPAGKIDLNRATAEQLDGLPGVGPVTAQRILEWRTRNGRFTRVDQLREIEGIGERRFGQLRELVTV